MSDLLINIPKKRIQSEILDVLKQHWPMAIHIYYFIKTNLEWLENNPKLKSLDVYSTERNELFVVITKCELMPNKISTRVMVHSPTLESEKIKQILLKTDVINWADDFLFEALHEKDIQLVKDICELKNRHYDTDGLFNQVWLPPEKQKDIKVEVPSDMYIGDLTKEHAVIMNDTWRYKYPGSYTVVEDTIVYNKGLGLFRKSDNKLVAWNSTQHFGGLGMLYTADDERGKGYGTIVTAALAKYHVEKKIDPYACIKICNGPSNAVYKKLGFEVANRVTWLIIEREGDNSARFHTDENESCKRTQEAS